MTPEELAKRLAERPRVRLAQLPTPLHPAPRFSAEIGVEVWLKRDDLTGVAMGGNKIRKLEFLLGDAREAGADCLITVGAGQSNHARTVAAVAAMSGMDCHLVLGGDRPDRPTGNLLLSSLLGAEPHFTGVTDWDALESAARDLRDTLAAGGRRPYLMPIGGSTPVGALGFVAAYLELRQQAATAGIAPAAIVHATSSGGTQAGLHAARRLLGDGPDAFGVGVAKTAGVLQDEVAALAGAVAEALGGPDGDAGAAERPLCVEGFMGRTYAEPTPGGTEALRLLLRTEGVLSDPVYSAKALHAVVRDGARFSGGRPLVFWHTGGTPAVFSDEHAPAGW